MGSQFHVVLFFGIPLRAYLTSARSELRPHFFPLKTKKSQRIFMNNKKAIERLTEIGHSRFLIVEELRTNCVPNTLEQVTDLKKQIDEIDVEINSILEDTCKEMK